MKKNKKYLILVPRIILMEQIHDEIIRHKPELKNTIQCIGDTNNDYNESKNICICVYNSVSLIEPYFELFTKIYIDEAHHIDKPMIYDNDENINDDNIEEDLNEDILDLDDDIEDEQDIELIDDEEDEIKETTGYHNIIKTLSKYNNNVYLSATIDEIKDFTYYKKDIRDMIEMKYLCDYNIHIPIFSNDITNMNICEHLIKNYRNIIIYCNSQKEGNNINTLMNTLQKGCSEYIDCNTSKTKRNNIIKKYKEGLIPFLVNVRILVEGFDAPITKGICFMHLPSSKTTLIQIIGRALRLHPLKTIAHIILPFSTKEDESNINNFLKVMANNDKRIRQSYENKKIGGYISIENTIEDVKEEENTDFEFRYNMIFDNMGKLLNGEEIWMKRLEEVKDYIDKNQKTPKKDSKNIIIKNLGIWISTQKYTYRLNKMIKNRIPIWETFIKDYNKYFISFRDNWLLKYNNFIKDINNNIYINWFNNQKQNYKKKIGFYKDTVLKLKWEILMKQYPKLFESLDKKWNNTLLWIDNYILLNNKRPDKIDNIYEYRWLTTQTVDYNYKRHFMKQDIYRQKWELFTNKYSKIFINNDTIWIDNYNLLHNYIKENNKFPNSKKENTKNLANWYNYQKDKIKEDKLSEDKIVLINKLKEKFPDVMKTEFDIWKDVLQTIINFINVNNKLPTANKNNESEFNLASWIQNQKRNYKNNDRNMKNIKFKQKWTEFINNPKYNKYFITDKNTDGIEV
jgi:superfamily II DNA or RNA helicase